MSQMSQICIGNGQGGGERGEWLWTFDFVDTVKLLVFFKTQYTSTQLYANNSKTKTKDITLSISILKAICHEFIFT